MQSLTSNKTVILKPFLRWAGGRTWLLKHLGNIKQSQFNNYHEAFLGGAATYFFLQPSGHSYLSDLNGDLIETYQELKDNAPEVIKKLKTFKNTEEAYYEIRSSTLKKSAHRAARFIPATIKGPFGTPAKAPANPKSLGNGARSFHFKFTFDGLRC